ncbi:MAG TPA: YfiR family protein [Verrucomicrobiae bacterium]|jgi:hypothetical protein|nr:YfiR family protein [Verrucomicrobiae bacterium]
MNHTRTNRPAGRLACPAWRGVVAWFAGTGSRRRWMIQLLLLLSLFFQCSTITEAETGALTEYQVKALFLLNFSKYIDWPAEAFAQPDSPIVISILGENKFGDDLEHALAGKTVNDRKIVIRPITSDSDWAKCHILFISASEKRRTPDVLVRVRSLPVLTVGETEQFAQQGGIINFTKRDGKVRLEIDLHAAQQARLQISSRLLSVADVVRGKP